ncbi:MAG: UbiA family prenyltransferase [Bacteroidota bacterium]
MNRIYRFFVYSNLFIAACAILMVNQTYQFLLHSLPNCNFLFFVFFSTICSYSFHWYLESNATNPSPRSEWAIKYRYLHLSLLSLALVGSGIFFFYLIEYWHWLLLSAIITFIYSAPKIPNKYFRALRKMALGKTIFLAMVWTYVTTILPILISKTHWQADHVLFIISRFFFIYAICILFDYRDRQDDKAAGIRSLITYLSERNIFYLFAVSLIVFATTTIGMLSYNYSLVHIIMILLPGLILAVLYNYAKKNFSDFFYYFILDGLMALSAILMLIGGI